MTRSLRLELFPDLVQGLWSQVWSLGFMLWGLGCRVEGPEGPYA